MEEIWKDIPNYEGFVASNLGRVKRLATKTMNKNGTYRRLNEKILTNSNNGVGYFSVMLSIRGRKPFRRYVHRLVAMAFLDMDESMQVDHINFDKSDNRVENLRVVTQRENNHFYQKNSNIGKTSKYVGVCLDEVNNKYRAYLYIGKDHYILGSYETEEEAKKVYDKALYNWNTKGEVPYDKKLSRREKRKNRSEPILVNTETGALYHSIEEASDDLGASRSNVHYNLYKKVSENKYPIKFIKDNNG